MLLLSRYNSNAFFIVKIA